jgi:hypothetical protein
MLDPDLHTNIMNTVRYGISNNDYRIGVESGTTTEARSGTGPGDSLKVGSRSRSGINVQKLDIKNSVADPGCLDPGSDFFPSRIPDPNCLHPASRILIKEYF